MMRETWRRSCVSGQNSEGQRKKSRKQKSEPSDRKNRSRAIATARWQDRKSRCDRDGSKTTPPPSRANTSCRVNTEPSATQQGKDFVSVEDHKPHASTMTMSSEV